MDGLINVLKPPGMTSHDVVAWLRRLFKMRKIGHAGTLDPDAAGVLPVALGKGTRLLEFFLDSPKSYRCEAVLGITTDTQDVYGNVLYREMVSLAQKERLPVILESFAGEILQIPPMVSAVRYRGKRLYELARQGKTVERSPRPVRIYRLEIIESLFEQVPPRFYFDVVCSKGTYIRTLCHDLGQKLGCGAAMSFLLRTGAAHFRLEDTYTLEEIAASWHRKEKDFLLPLEKVLGFPEVQIKKTDLPSILNGNPV
ncbi:MAG TPA: tRNA pseudouridine(55) synthase TruB, partial [Clostridia bacterium]|nr:tRNA pseudouridine(55) synthase TruB [Clostridia bacterium]